MPETLPRKRFQIHLSTAIVMMFVAGGLIWANTHARYGNDASINWEKSQKPDERIRFSIKESEVFQDDYLSEWRGYAIRNYGWPVDALETQRQLVLKQPPPERSEDGFVRMSWRLIAVGANAIIAMVALFATFFLCEWLICRRAARNEG